jgi:chromosome segregation ATPase|mmetsp:Transcript_8987/g.14561  ORF Transcript_8987/g.14561 Transcript_8987/m.14561 type:complete len:316 (-) Transcript_8987:79-1026(-)
MFGKGLLCFFVIGDAATVYDPHHAAKALDDVEKALAQITHLPHLTKAQMAEAKKVTADVEKTVSELESPAGQKLSKEARNAKVTASVKELAHLQTMWSKTADVAIADRKLALERELKEKEEELEKDKKMMKVLTLEKKLAEKKLKLQNMIDQKNAQQAKRQAAKEAAEQQAMVSAVMDLAKNMKAAKGKTVIAEKLKPVMSYLENRKKIVSDSLAKIDAEETKREGEISALTSAKMPVKDGKDPLAKSQGMLTMLAKQEHRAYLKARAPIQSELKELNQAVDGIKNGDVAALSKIMGHMQSEMKSLQAKSQKFLY